MREFYRPNKQTDLILPVSALGDLDFNITDKEASFGRWFEDLLDLKPSEFMALCVKEGDLAIRMNYFGKTYMENAKS